MTVCGPSERLVGGDQFHDPFDKTVVVPAISVSE